MNQAATEVFLLLLLLFLFLAEFIVSLFTHALVLRFDTCHTLILAIIALSLVYKRKKFEQFAAERFITFWLTVSYVAMVAFCVVHVIYSLQMLSLIIHMHFHEMDIHYPLWIMSLGSISLVIKFVCAFYLDSGFTDIRWAHFSKALFHFVPPLTVLIVSTYRVAQVVVWFDPVMNALCNIITFACLYAPLATLKYNQCRLVLQDDIMADCSSFSVKEHVLILLLTVPKKIDIARMKDCFDIEFNDIRYTDLTLWRDSKSRINVSVHVSLDRFVNYSETCLKIERFFQTHGAHRVCIEPKFVSSK